MEDDLHDLMASEGRRGRRPVDVEARKKGQRLRKDLGRVLRLGDEQAFLKILREAGLKDGTPEFARALKVFREESGGRW